MSGTVFVAESEVAVSENAGWVTQRILRTGSLDGEVTITYGITADTATAGQDFTGGTGTVTMAAGAAEVSVPIRILNDNAGEATEVFVFSAINVAGANLFAPRTSRISILDDETPAPPPPAEPPLQSDYTVTLVPVVRGLDQPLRVEFSPIDPGLAYIAEKPGVILAADTDTGERSVMLDIRDRVNDHQDRGLLDIALHPDFASNGYLYAFIVVDPAGTQGLTGNAGPDGVGNRYAQLLRFTADASTGFTTILPDSEVVLLGGAGRSLDDISGRGRTDHSEPEFAAAPSSERYVNTAAPSQTIVGGFKQDYIKVDSLSHAGGGLIFGPDGALYVSTGDGTSPNYADPRSPDVVDLDSLSGKILRIDPITGDGLPDNPFATPGIDLDLNRAKVFQLGLRNPFSLAFDEEGRLFMTNTGWDSFEMIMMGGPGANFGWPYFEGGDGGVLERAPAYAELDSAAGFYDAVARGDITIVPPFRAFGHASSEPGFQVQAITGGSAIYTGTRYPAAFQDDFFFTDFAGGEVYTVDTRDRAQVQFLYKTQDGIFGPIDYVQGADGRVYYVDLPLGEVGYYVITEGEPPPPPPPREGKEVTVGSGPDALVLRISQDAWEGDALYTVRVDGVQIGGTLSAQASHIDGLSDTVTVRGSWGTGGHTATVTFLNDGYGGSNNADRNLYVDGASYNGVAIPGLVVNLYAAGAESFGFTDTGTVEPPPPPPPGGSVTIGSGPDALVLRITQDAWEGDAQYTVSVDGMPINGTLSARALRGSGQVDTVTVLGNWASGSHVFTIDFLNDAWGGSAATDRNLYLEGATYNGVALPGAVGELAIAGPQSFAFTEAGTPPPPPGASTTIGSGPDALVLRIAQDAWQGNAQYTISVDGVLINGTLTAQASHAAGQADTVTVLGNWAPGNHTLTLNFLNDDWGGSAATDRNLYLESATYNGVAVAGATSMLGMAGPQNFTFTEPGTPPPPSGGSVTIGSGPDALVLRIAQDAWQGSAQYTVSVDGVQIAGTLTAQASHAAGQADTVTVLGSWAAGPHTLTVNFLNDDWGGSAAADRNLYLESATYNGAAVAGATAMLGTAGPRNFSFTEAGTPPPPSGGSVTIGSGPDALVLRIAQDAWQGSAQYTVSVDGVPINGTLTAQASQAAGEVDTVTVLGNWAPGNHTLTVNFLNDDWGGSAATDRNLYLEGATYNGVAVAGATAMLGMAGPQSFAFTDVNPIG
jgi:glucose/arabinose dehydrogenase